ncbi:DUF3883 domain-containing protein [Diaphorobacter sp. LR2014-1]|uniref:protein NO VEIN domain-containing protein n=1 Tax=Diaphorobacter sp. LR2014-1 TaxID=1933219 RepID=UPI001FF081C4|nr:DUF3883 domain-containing protein [Diaphorobacter sp. LR2014-1]
MQSLRRRVWAARVFALSVPDAFEKHFFNGLLGIERHPKWIAIEDNTAGYDVQSYDTGLTEPVSKLIEVKSCSRELVQIFITRNEWETAISSAPHYQFHVWLLPEKKLIELSVNDIAPHIPQNQGHGIWQSVGVTLHQEFP